METPLPGLETPENTYTPTSSIRDWIARQTWTYAKTVPDQPHWYLVRARLPQEEHEGWSEMYEAIRDRGRKHRFMGRTYKYLQVDEYDYFTGPPGLMNRRHHLDADAEITTWNKDAHPDPIQQAYDLGYRGGSR